MKELILTHWPWLVLWAGIASAWAFCLMGFDKRRARDGGRRVRERTFFLVALLGGAPGAIIGMYFFRHKTRHWYFKWGLPAILLPEVALLWAVLR